jgi:hypothetical protein
MNWQIRKCEGDLIFGGKVPNRDAVGYNRASLGINVAVINLESSGTKAMPRSILRLVISAFSVALMSNAIGREFEVGQVWSYKTRAGEENSTLLIDRVEVLPKVGEVFHISVSSVAVKNPHSPSGKTTDLPHFPVSRKTLDDSVIAVVGHAEPNPAFEQGYAEWKRANGGVFTISVSAIVDTVEKMVNR